MYISKYSWTEKDSRDKRIKRTTRKEQLNIWEFERFNEIKNVPKRANTTVAKPTHDRCETLLNNKLQEYILRKRQRHMLRAIFREINRPSGLTRRI